MKSVVIRAVVSVVVPKVEAQTARDAAVGALARVGKRMRFFFRQARPVVFEGEVAETTWDGTIESFVVEDGNRGSLRLSGDGKKLIKDGCCPHCGAGKREKREQGEKREERVRVRVTGGIYRTRVGKMGWVVPAAVANRRVVRSARVFFDDGSFEMYWDDLEILDGDAV